MIVEKDKKMTALHRSDMLELIVEHAENQGLLTVPYQAGLSIMTDNQLAVELDRLEAIALSYLDMPANYGLGCSRN
jgi:hypothetical protein